MVDHKDLPIPETANKLKYLLHKHQLPVGGLLYDGYMQMCKESSAHDSIKKPLIVDLPWVADAFAEEDKRPGIDITDEVLDLVKRYIEHNKKTATGVHTITCHAVHQVNEAYTE